MCGDVGGVIGDVVVCVGLLIFGSFSFLSPLQILSSSVFLPGWVGVGSYGGSW